MGMLKRLKKRWYVLLIILVLGFIAYQKLIATPAKKADEKKYTLKRKNLEETLSLSGKVDAEEKATIRFQTSGKLAWVGVKEGDYVKKYQGIASLDQRQTKKTLEKYLYDYSKERNDFEEAKQTTYPSGAVTDTIKRILEKNQYDLNKAVLDVELQNISLEYSYLYTPIEGIVTKVGAPFAGVNITPAQAEFEIVNPKTIFFSATVDQTDVVGIKEGMKGKIVFDSYPDDSVVGTIKQISFSPKTGETNTSYEVKVNIPNIQDESKYRLEMTGDIDFVTKVRNNVLVIPDAYIKSENGKKYAYKQVNGKKIKTTITLGDEIDSYYEIISGLREGDIIYD